MSDNITIKEQKSVVSKNTEEQRHLQNPKFPQYSSREDRANSFALWHHDSLVSKETLFEAGLFYTGNLVYMFV